MPRQRGLSNPRPKKKRPPAPQTGEETTPPTPDAADPPPPAPDDADPPRTDPSPKLSHAECCRAATKQVKRESAALGTLYKTLMMCYSASENVIARNDKVYNVLDQQKHSKKRLTWVQERRKIDQCERRATSAEHNIMVARLAVAEQREIVQCAHVVSRDMQIARLRALLRKHRIPMKSA